MIDYKTYQTSTVSVSQNNESPIAEYFNTYLQLNPAIGYLTFEVFNDSPVRGRAPVPNARITISKLLGDDINKALDSLSEEHAEIFRMYLYGFRYQEIADCYHIPEGTIKSRIHIARKILQAKLKMHHA